MCGSPVGVVAEVRELRDGDAVVLVPLAFPLSVFSPHCFFFFFLNNNLL